MDVKDEDEKDSILKSVLTFGANFISSPDLIDKPSTSGAGNICNKDNNDSSSDKKKFKIDRHKIHAIANESQDTELQNLGLDVYNQDEFEEGVLAQVDAELAAQEEIRLNMQLEKEMKAIQDDVSTCQQEVKHCEKVIEELSPQVEHNKEIKRKLNAVKMQKDNKMRQLKRLEGRQRALIQKTQRSIQALQDQEQKNGNGAVGLQQNLGLPKRRETETERMVRMGEMTPFGTVMTSQDQKPGTSQLNDFEKYLMDQQNKESSKKTSGKLKKKRTNSELEKFNSKQTDEPSVKQMKKSRSMPVFDGHYKQATPNKSQQNYFDSIDKKTYRPLEKDFSNYKSSKRAIYPKLKHNFSGSSRPDFDPEEECDSDDYYRDNNYEPSPTELLDEEEYEEDIVVKRSKSEVDLGAIKEKYTGRKKKISSGGGCNRPGKDDGNLDNYEHRLKAWRKKELQIKREKIFNGEDGSEESDIEFDGGFKVPAKIWNKLYKYQKTGVKWLWELHVQQCGGIVGDEMGLGKTIQMISFLVGLQNSQLRDKGTNIKFKGLGPTIIVCPATVMHQWVKEFHTWWPPFRVAVLHNTGSYTQKLTEKDLVYNIVKNCGILITSYSSIVIHQEILLQYDWHYIVLDEGHKIRNPDAQTTLACKRFRTCHRIILSGSPMQNNLKELWSLFDFVFPGKLGTLPDFMAHFSVPIVQGGYSNASQIQVQTAYKCACVLRDTINPYLIRRMKADVKTSLQLPQKNEQVLFCRLTEDQKDIYQEYLDSKECDQILRGEYMVFPGLITLRKICNHPDISTGGLRSFNLDPQNVSEEELEYGYYRRSGKMIVIESLLKLWKKQNHKVLLFTQGKQMLDVLERFVHSQGYNYLRMDGTTNISGRQPLIKRFNESPEIFIFLLTTRVGGLGVNLTGANRVVIYDPDWNPSTDTQARERAWRIGQNKQVTVYRLITTGTIEEKIYHRQIFKQFLTNRVLKDPKQRRFFKSNDLFELFTLGTDDPNIGSETSAIFAGTGSDVKVKLKSKDKDDSENRQKNRFDVMREKKKAEEEDPDIDVSGTNEGEVDHEQDKLTQMRELAKRLSIQFSNKAKTLTDSTDGKTEQSSNSLFENSLNTESDKSKTDATGSSNTVDDNVVKSSQNRTEAISEEEERMRRRKEKKRKKREEEERRKEEERKKRKKKKKKDVVFEGEKIAHLDHYKPYVKPNSDDEDSKKGDEYVLQRLFKKTGGLHSAIQHDNIMQSSNPDYALVEAEADRVAKDAARALKRSRQNCFRAQSGMPTWTGNNGVSKPRFGQKKNTKLVSEVTKEEKVKTEKKVQKPVVDILFAPDPVVKHFDGSLAGNMKTGATPAAVATPNVMTSSQLLETMRARNHLTKQPDGNGSDSDYDPDNPWAQQVSIDTNPEFVDLMTDIRNHVAFGCAIDGQASTDELLEHFQTRLPPKDTAKFKAMLKQICSFNKKEGIGIWRLKQEFR